MRLKAVECDIETREDDGGYDQPRRDEDADDDERMENTNLATCYARDEGITIEDRQDNRRE